MNRNFAAAAAVAFGAAKKLSPSEIYEIKRRAPTVYGNVDAGIINAGVIKGSTRGFIKIHGGFDPIWTTGIQSVSPSFEFVKLSPDTLNWNSLEASCQIWTSINWQPEPISVTGLLQDIGEHVVRVSNDPPLSMHKDIRASNRIYCFIPESSSERTSEERRYKELNAKYYADALSPAEKAELEDVEQKLDELDDKDLGLVELAGGIDKGYDKLESGLRRINGILDELLKQ
jgi:hypothetical protein